MKLLIIEGPDRCGKSSLIKGICEYYNYDNISIRHFGKPPKSLLGEAALSYQLNAFYKEAELFSKSLQLLSDYYSYYENTFIWNRSHLGEYIYGPMFRNANMTDYSNVVKNSLSLFEKKYFSTLKNVYLITLVADPKFNLSKEDGNSFSQTLEQKTKEIELFKEAHEFSIIHPKLLLKVDENGAFRPKEDILNEVLEFIENGSRK